MKQNTLSEKRIKVQQPRVVESQNPLRILKLLYAATLKC
jgi:hypothetical protein